MENEKNNPIGYQTVTRMEEECLHLEKFAAWQNRQQATSKN